MIMYVPQRPYMPIGTLREAILFPDKENAELGQDVERVLKACHLEHLIPRLSETAAWTDQLSPVSSSVLLLHVSCCINRTGYFWMKALPCLIMQMKSACII